MPIREDVFFLVTIRFIPCTVISHMQIYLESPRSSATDGGSKWNYSSQTLYMIYLLTAIRLSPSGSSIVHIYTQTIHRTIQRKQYIEQHNNILEECGPCPVLASYTLAFALQLRKKHGKTSVRVAASKNT